MDISLLKLTDIVNAASYSTAGDDREIKYGHLLEDFPNSEKFWKLFIVPMTNRIVTTTHNSLRQIQFRNGVEMELQEMASFHYSVFINIVYAHKVFESRHISFFENFYAHLGSICDSTEEFLMRIYFLILRSNKVESELLHRLSKNKFMKLANNWFDEHYGSIFNYYLNKGKKPPPIPLPGRSNILDEYFEGYQPWNDFVRFSQLIKQYRNAIVHNYQIGFVQNNNGQHFVPKKEKIPKYKKWDEVFKGAADSKKFANDFIDRETQMVNDLKEMQNKLQGLWDKPVNDINDLLYRQQNAIILNQYDLRIV